MSMGADSPRHSNWYLLTGILLGLILGLVYAWVIAPGTSTATSPSALRPDFKDQYRLAIASAYQATGDLERARSRLALLGDPDPVKALNDQAERALLAGDPENSLLPLSNLAQAIQQSVANQVPSPAATSLEQTAPSAEAADTSRPSPGQVPSPTPGGPFAVTMQENICDASLPPGLLQVEIQDGQGKGVPGIELMISWSGGEDHFFSGLKPKLGNGYADYEMTPGITYSLQLSVDSSPVSGLTPPSCPAQAGKSFFGGLHLLYRQP